jgi:hypothetical protein
MREITAPSGTSPRPGMTPRWLTPSRKTQGRPLTLEQVHGSVPSGVKAVRAKQPGEVRQRCELNPSPPCSPTSVPGVTEAHVTFNHGGVGSNPTGRTMQGFGQAGRHRVLRYFSFASPYLDPVISSQTSVVMTASVSSLRSCYSSVALRASGTVNARRAQGWQPKERKTSSGVLFAFWGVVGA